MLHFGFFRGNFSLSSLVYYTVQSNLLCFLYFLVGVIRGFLQNAKGEYTLEMMPFPRFKGAVTMAIIATGLIYSVLLAPTSFSMDGTGGGWAAILNLGNLIVHIFIPILTLLDWLLFDPKGRYKKIDPLLWLVIPYLYFAFALLRAEIGPPLKGGGRYPYFFIDLDQYGVGQVALWVGAITLFFLGLGYLLYGVDHSLGKEQLDG